MKTRLLYLLLAMLFNTGVLSAQSQKVNISRDVFCAQQKRALVLKDTLLHRAGQNIDITYSRFEWEIDPAVLFIKGKVTMVFMARGEDVQNILLELNDNMTIDSIVFRGAGISSNFVSAYEFEILLDEPVPENQYDSLSIYYRGMPQAGTGFGSFIQDEHDGVPIIWTLSEPYGAKEWWPGKNDLTDKIDSIDVFVTTPAGYRAAGHGLLVSESLSGGTVTCHWRHRYPIVSYLVAVAVTNYAQFTNWAVLEGDSVPILNYVFPEDSASIYNATANTYEMLQLFDTLFTPYPFREEKYGHAQFGWGGGMEHQTMSYMGNFSHDIRAHELAHSWFGNMITLASWHDIFLNEGFATYSTGLSYEHMYDGYYWDIWKRNTMGAVVSEPWGSVYVQDTTDVSRIFDARLSYHKGAYLLHMLRWIMGDEPFFEAIRNYLNDPVLAYRFATLQDLKYHFETAGNTDLAEFFDDWYYGEGYPLYEINVGQEEDGIVTVTIHQQQSHPSVDFFEMPVPVQIFGDGLQKTLICQNTYSGEQFEFEDPGFAIDSVKFDMERWLAAKLISISLGTGEVTEINHRLIIQPNPAGDMIRCKVPHSPVRQVEIIDAVSRIVLIPDFKNNGNEIFIHVKNLPSGLYLLNVNTTDGVWQGKFVKN